MLTPSPARRCPLLSKMPATSTDKTRMATRTGTGAPLKPSRKARDAGECSDVLRSRSVLIASPEADAQLIEEVEAPPRKKTKKQRLNNENCAREYHRFDGRTNLLSDLVSVAGDSTEVSKTNSGHNKRQAY